MPLSRFVRPTALGLAAVLALQAPLARAEMIGAEAVQAEAAQNAPADPAEADRAKVRGFLEQSTLKDRLRAMGVDGIDAQRRVDAMTQDEVHALAQKIDSLPAGGALSDRDIILVLLVALLLVVAL